MAIKLGLECVLYRNLGTWDAPNWSAVGNVRDVTFTLDKAEADVTTRGGNGWRQMKATLKEGSLEFEMLWDSADTHFAAVLSAYLNNTDIEVLALDGAIDVSGHQGLRARWTVKSCTRNEALEEAVKASVSLKPTYGSGAQQPTWYTVP